MNFGKHSFPLAMREGMVFLPSGSILTDHVVDIERYEAQMMMMTCTDAATIRWQHIVSDHDIININVVDLWNSAAPWIMMVYKEVDNI